MTKRNKSYFTLVEIMIVVAVIGLLSAIAVPSFMNAGIKAQNNTFASQMRLAVGAFKQASLENDYPPDTTEGEIPSGMDEYLQNFPWQKETPIGGQWDWDYQVFGYKAGVSVYKPDVDAERMKDIDAIFDDGSLDSGKFRSRTDGYIYIIEASE